MQRTKLDQLISINLLRTLSHYTSRDWIGAHPSAARCTLFDLSDRGSLNPSHFCNVLIHSAELVSRMVPCFHPNIFPTLWAFDAAAQNWVHILRKPFFQPQPRAGFKVCQSIGGWVVMLDEPLGERALSSNRNISSPGWLAGVY